MTYYQIKYFHGVLYCLQISTVNIKILNHNLNNYTFNLSGRQTKIQFNSLQQKYNKHNEVITYIIYSFSKNVMYLVSIEQQKQYKYPKFEYILFKIIFYNGKRLKLKPFNYHKFVTNAF